MNIRPVKNKKRNWISVYNMAVEELKNELYDKCSKVYSANEDMFSEIYERVTESYNVTTLHSVEELEESDLPIIISGTMKKHKDNIEEAMNEAYEFATIAPIIILDKCASIAVISEKDFVKMKKRACLTRNGILSQIEYFLKDTVETFSTNMEDYLDSLVDSLEFIEELNKEDNGVAVDLDSDTENNKKFRVRKIYDYEEMNKLALSNGYEYQRSTGSHNVYKHRNTNKIIVIPAHSLGLGLSIKIQKQIYNNAC